MNKHMKRACILLLAGLLLVCVALGIHLWQLRQETMAGQTAALLLQQLELNRLPMPETEEKPDSAPADTQLPEKQYMGYTLIGSITVPSVGIQLPVLNDWSDQMLKVAPCRYQGSISGGNMIVMGHNYKTHFAPLRKVTVGAEVVFCNTAGREFRYKVAAIETMHRNEGYRLASEYPLTIFTCTPGGINRFVVRCELVQ